MKDQDFKDLETKYLAEKQRRDNISKMENEIYELDNLVKDLKTDNGFEWADNIAIIYTMFHDGGDGRSGSTSNHKYEIPLGSKKEFIKFLEDYVEAKAQKVNELMNEE